MSGIIGLTRIQFKFIDFPAATHTYTSVVEIALWMNSMISFYFVKIKMG